MSEKILLIDDDPDILELLTFNLERAGFLCLPAKDGREAWELLDREDPDLVILDIMLPVVSGFEVLRRLRTRSRTPVIVLTAKGEEVDRIVGLEMGADDYVVKPFSIRELMLRIRRTLQRSHDQHQPSADPDEEILRCDGITVDTARFQVLVQEEPVDLTRLEFQLIAFLIRNRGRVMSRDQILDHVWGGLYEGTARTVDTHIRRLRQKLGPEGSCISTVRGIGYRIEDQ